MFYFAFDGLINDLLIDQNQFYNDAMKIFFSRMKFDESNNFNIYCDNDF